ncbi:LysR family transcriptional regulator [Sporomusa sp. KB1]|jgi:DNA-binding transcriptional LysR family regulator|uniref:LysR family transcriptional regulator n=1 Tax=Sporomusa sp. KB1 TaxID=943346 RepID=UPI0011A1DEFC|nr:LysR family transcriptional regulator [Sporomusa sp. KB1]TWH47178.1 DNA-binding transcriptional LysR family regulator [Sporomusa sp. KB1]
METRQLEIFVCVAERLNFTESAKHLYLTQSAVSLQIADLEKHLGVKLFERNSRSVQLTEAGQVFLKEAKFIIAILEEAIKKTRHTASGFAGTLKVGFLESHTKHFLPKLVKDFRNSYPKIQLMLLQLNWGDLNMALEHNDVDIGLTMSVSLQNTPHLVWQSLLRDVECFVMPYDHPLANQPQLDLAAVAREPFIVLNREVAPCPYDFTLQLCANRGFTPKIVERPYLTEILLTLVESGEGIAILPYFATKPYASPNLRFIKLEGEDAQVDMVASWKKINRNPAIPLFLNKAKNNIQIIQNDMLLPITPPC